MNAYPRRTYTRRQRTVPLEACLTRQPLRQTVTPVLLQQPVVSPRPVAIWGTRGSLLLAAAVGGMGTGAGVMALLLPSVKPGVPAVATRIEPAVKAIAPHPEVLVAPQDTRPIVAAVLSKGGRPDPFAPVLAVQPLVPVHIAAQPVAAPTLADLPAPPTFVAALPKTATRILPPPAMIRQILPPIASAPAGTVPVNPSLDTLPAMTPVAALNPVDATEDTLAIPTQPFVIAPVEGTPATPVAPSEPAPLPALAAVVVPNEGAFSLIGTAIAGDNRIALIRTGTDATPLAVAMGDTVAGWRVRSIDENHVVLTQGSAQQTLKVGS